jgi:hypothetical protein
MTHAENQRRHTFLPILLLVLSIAAYLLPWSTSSINSLSLGAYDLAEWVNSLPTASLLLRLQLLLISLIFMLTYLPAQGWGRGLGIAIILLLTIAQLPPLDFITRSNDTNQQQQFALAIGTLLGAGFSLWLATKPQKTGFALLIALIGIITSILGEMQAIAFMQQYRPDAAIGIGLPLLISAYVLWSAWSINQWRKNRIAR